jgi:hypothetical protein
MLHLEKCNFKTQKNMKKSTIIKQSIEPREIHSSSIFPPLRTMKVPIGKPIIQFMIVVFKCSTK